MRLLPALAALLAAAPAFAQATASDAAEVVAAAQQLFDAMEARDSTALREALHPDAQILSVGPAGSVQGGPAQRWAQYVARSEVPGRERIWNPRVEIDGDLATLWGRYDFHFGDQFSHCGADAFQFVREAGGRWRVLVVTFTVETEGCDPDAQP